MKNKFSQFLKYDFQKAFNNPNNGLDENCCKDDSIDTPLDSSTLGIMFDFSEDLGVCVQIEHEGSHRHIQFVFENKDKTNVNVVFLRDSWEEKEEFNCDDPAYGSAGYWTDNYCNIPETTLNYLGVTQEEINSLYEISNNLISFVKERNDNLNNVMDFLKKNEFNLDEYEENIVSVEINQNDNQVSIYLNEQEINYSDISLPYFESYHDFVTCLKSSLNKFEYSYEVEQKNI